MNLRTISASGILAGFLTGLLSGCVPTSLKEGEIDHCYAMSPLSIVGLYNSLPIQEFWRNDEPFYLIFNNTQNDEDRKGKDQKANEPEEAISFYSTKIKHGLCGSSWYEPQDLLLSIESLKPQTFGIFAVTEIRKKAVPGSILTFYQRFDSIDQPSLLGYIQAPKSPSHPSENKETIFSTKNFLYGFYGYDSLENQSRFWFEQASLETSSLSLFDLNLKLKGDFKKIMLKNYPSPEFPSSRLIAASSQSLKVTLIPGPNQSTENFSSELILENANPDANRIHSVTLTFQAPATEKNTLTVIQFNAYDIEKNTEEWIERIERAFILKPL